MSIFSPDREPINPSRFLSGATDLMRQDLACLVNLKEASNATYARIGRGLTTRDNLVYQLPRQPDEIPLRVTYSRISGFDRVDLLENREPITLIELAAILQSHAVRPLTLANSFLKMFPQSSLASPTLIELRGKVLKPATPADLERLSSSLSDDYQAVAYHLIDEASLSFASGDTKIAYHQVKKAEVLAKAIGIDLQSTVPQRVTRMYLLQQKATALERAAALKRNSRSNPIDIMNCVQEAVETSVGLGEDYSYAQPYAEAAAAGIFNMLKNELPKVAKGKATTVFSSGKGSTIEEITDYWLDRVLFLSHFAKTDPSYRIASIQLLLYKLTTPLWKQWLEPF